MDINIILATILAAIHSYIYTQKIASVQGRIALLLLLWNPLVIDELLHRPSQIIFLSLLLIRASHVFPSFMNHALDLFISFRPPYLCISLIRQKNLLFIGFKIVYALVMIKLDVGRQIFPTVFPAQENAMWLLNMHMFSTYTVLYQLLLVLVPFLLVYPLRLMRMPIPLKEAIIFYFCAFSYNTSYPILGLFMFYGRMFGEMREKKLQNGFDLWSLLTIVIVVVDVMFYGFYLQLRRMWEHTHMTNMGYIFIYQMIFWVANAVYLSEGVVFFLPQPEEEKFSFKKFIRQRVKQI